MVGEAYTVQSVGLGGVDQVVDRHEAIVGLGVGVGMEVYQHRCSFAEGGNFKGGNMIPNRPPVGKGCPLKGR